MRTPLFLATIAFTLAACSGGGKDNSTGPTTGTIDIAVTNPSGAPAHITITGSSNTYHVTGSQTLTNVPPGTYRVDVDTLTTLAAIFLPNILHDSVHVVPSNGPAVLSIVFTRISNDETILITGLPAGVKAGVELTHCSANDSVRIDSTTTLHLIQGCYQLRVGLVQANDTSYGTAWVSANQVNLGFAPVDTFTLPYGPWFDSLVANAQGLPGGTHASVQITGPFAFSTTLSVSGRKAVGRVPAGRYTFSWSQVNDAGSYYVPTPANDIVTMLSHDSVGGSTATYALFDLTIDHMYLTQEVQRVDGSVPLIAGKDGYLRVFGKATVTNTATPKVRVRWYSSGSLVRTDTIADPAAFTPVNVDDGTSGFSWDEKIAGAFIQPGLSVLADINPDGAVQEQTSNDAFPVGGTPLALDVRSADSAHITIVPVTILAQTGSPGAGGWSAFAAFTQSIHPLPGIVLTVHSTYVSSSTQPLESGDANGVWGSVLNEIQALEVAESAPATEHYYGVVHPSYTAGVAGVGFIGGPGAIGWDRSIADQVMAHEIGHNWNRLHSPCGNPSQVDPSYPYTGGIIGQPGFDVPHATPMPATSTFDVMSYCQPYWISDYTFQGVLDWRAINEDRVRGIPPANLDVQPVVIVWGRVHGSDLVLEPAFETTARPRRPEGRGDYTLEGLDESGGRVFAYGFDGAEIADGTRGDRSFAFAIPVSEIDRARLHALRVSGKGAMAEREGRIIAAAERAGAARAESKLSARASGGGATSVTWDAASYPLAVVKDARTGEILSLARGGSVRVRAKGAALDVTLSDGVRSVRETIH